MEEIANTLKTAENEATESPYWLILDPIQNMACDIHQCASQITGPFFCREDAQNHLVSRRYVFSDRATVYCLSGYWSTKYKKLCRSLNI